MADLSHAAVFWFSSKIPSMGFMENLFLTAGRKFAAINGYFMFAIHFNQVLAIATLSVNRFTALLPKYE